MTALQAIPNKSDKPDIEKGAEKRKAYEVSGLAFLALCFQGLGIIYSDIGTSPLYVLNGIWHAHGPFPPQEDIIGGISAIIWAVTILPLVKYVLISLYFGTDEGEGGTFALYQGLYPRSTIDADSDRVLTGDSFMSKRDSGAKISEKLRWPLLAWCLLGTALTMADGIFTPAVSVTSAVGGIAIAKESVSGHVIPISIAFLIVLFLAQPFGTGRLSSMFAPVTFFWLSLIGISGIVNITHFPGIFRAFDPSRAVLLFVRTKNYDLLAGIILSLTGCEAMFANLGQFNPASIRVTFSFFVYPMLLLAYLGQGARLCADREPILSNIFYNTIPGPANGVLFWITYIAAILATLIASQALITATFSLVQQIVNMKGLPPLEMVYTSDRIQGQVYIPVVNWILMIATIVVVAAFKSSTALTNAYGFAVATVMISTTILLATQMRYVKFWPATVPIAFLVIFGFFDGLFFGASLKKVPEGAWVPLMIGGLLMLLMFFWTWAKQCEDLFDGANRQNLRHFIIPRDDVDEDDVKAPLTVQLLSGPSDLLNEADASDAEDEEIDVLTSPPRKPKKRAQEYYYVASGENLRSGSSVEKDKRELKEITRIPSCAIFHKLAAGRGIPHSFVGFIRQWPALPRVVIFLSVRVLPVARVSEEDRYVVNKVRTVQGFYAVTYYLGFREDFHVNVDHVVERICSIETRADPRESSETVNLIKRCATVTTHIVPHYHVLSRKINAGFLSPVVDWVRGLLIDGIYRRLSATFPETANWLESADEIIHVGVTAVI